MTLPNFIMPRVRKTHSRGVSVVELALVLPVVLALLIGILEAGWLSRAHLSIANATREGARSASLGKTTSTIRTRIINAAAPVTVGSDKITLEYSTDNGTTYYALGDSGTQNAAPGGSMVRVTVAQPHQSLTKFFPFMNNRTIRVKVVMRREVS